MSPTAEDLRERLDQLLQAALSLPPEQRARFIAESGEEATVRAQALGLLAQTVEPAPLLAETSVNPAAPPPARPLAARPRIAGYSLIRELGSGGMGTVYLAERELDGAVQRVALKLLHGHPSHEARRRLARERALLAGLNHPGIAALLDGGDTADGHAWLAMEYIEGEPLSIWMRQQRPTLEVCLRLFLRLCDAVQHAHQRLVLHRDIKPGNVLIDNDGVPVLLDFGIGRVLDESLSQDVTATLVFTPAYAAPEQRVGKGLTTATDVFGLGAVLFELVSGKSLTELRREDQALKPPSHYVDETARRRQVRGDLDRIVQKAMHEAPERRYASAQALAEDIQRFLRGQPVLATPDSLGYRLRKLIARHRVASVAALLAVLIATAFVWRLNLERTRALAAEAMAAAEADSAKASRDFLVSVFEAAAPEQTLGRPVSIPDLLAAASARLQQQADADPRHRYATWATLADTYGALGDRQLALRAAEAALGSLAELPTARPAEHAAAHKAVAANLYELGRFEEGATHYRDAQDWLARDPETTAAERADLWAAIGYAHQLDGEPAASAKALQQALAELDASGEDSADNRVYVRAGLLFAAIQLEQWDEAEAQSAAADREAAALPADHPSRLNLLRSQATLLQTRGDPERAVAKLREALRIAETTKSTGNSSSAGIHNDLGVALNDLGRYKEALVHLEASLRLNAAMQGEDSVGVAHLKANLGALYENLGDYARAEMLAREALASFARHDYRNDMVTQTTINLSRALSFAGEHDESVRLLQEVVDAIAAREAPESLNLAVNRFRLAGNLRRAGRLEAAQAQLDAAAPMLLQVLGAEHPVQMQVKRQQAMLRAARGDHAEALADFEAALDLGARLQGIAASDVAEVRVEYAESLLQLGRKDEARAQVDQAETLLREALLPGAVALQRLARVRARLVAG